MEGLIVLSMLLSKIWVRSQYIKDPVSKRSKEDKDLKNKEGAE